MIEESDAYSTIHLFCEVCNMPLIGKQQIYCSDSCGKKDRKKKKKKRDNQQKLNRTNVSKLKKNNKRKNLIKQRQEIDKEKNENF